MSARREGGPSGIAIVAALYFITIVGVLAVAVLFGARQWSRAGHGALRDAALTARADELLVGSVGDWSMTERAEQPVGSRVAMAVAVGPFHDRIEATAYITRLTRSLYWLQANVRSAGSLGGRHRVNLLVRVPVWVPPTRSPLLSAGDVLLGANARVVVDGTGSTDCLSNAESVAEAAITLPPDARLVLAVDYPAAERPSARIDSVASLPLALLAASGVSWEALAQRADIRVVADAHRSPLPETDANGCVDNLTNWGEPLRQTPASPCEGRRRIIYAAGDLTLDGGRAQGVVLVEGRLRLAGPLVFSGVVIARGGIETVADGVDMTGVVISGASNAAHAGEAPVSLRHESTIRLGVCDAQYGMTSTMQPRVVRERGWAELF
jgi:hypothetical protein